MNSRINFRDYPVSFWFAVLATITAAFLAISSYSRMINDDTATLKAAMIVISFEGALIVAMAVMNGRLQGLLRGWAFVMLIMLALAEIFMASMAIQHGIAEAGANAVNYQQSATNIGTVAGGMAEATKALSDCDKRYPRKKKDAAARETCRKPYEAIVGASAGAMPTSGNAPKYDEADAGKLAQWQAVADVLNSSWKPVTPVTWAQAAFYVMTAIMALFIMVKNFLWSKYMHEKAFAAAVADGHVVMPETQMGQPHHDHDEEDDHDHAPEPVKKQGFGLIPSGHKVASSAERNRASGQTHTARNAASQLGIPSDQNARHGLGMPSDQNTQHGLGIPSLAGPLKAVADDLYPEWVAAVAGKKITHAKDPCQKFIWKRASSEDGKQVLSAPETARIWEDWQARAAQAGTLNPNPKYQPGNRQPKYILA